MRILLVTPRPLAPIRRGHQLRAWQLARGLAALGHRVTVLEPGGETQARPAAEPGEEAEVFARIAVPVRPVLAPLGAASAFLLGLPAQSGIHLSRALADATTRLARDSDLVVLQLARLGGLASRLEGVPVVADLVDSLALNFERRARFERRWARLFFRLEARRMLAWERALVRRTHGAWVVSERDRAWLATRLEPTLAAKLARVPLALEASPPPAAAPRARSAARAVVTGNLGYFPTQDGLRRFLAECWPVVRARRPELELVLAGARPPRHLVRAARRAGARVVPEPADLAAVLAESRIALVPLDAGSGVPIKLLEAWAAGVPVVASPWAAAGAEARPGLDHLPAERPTDWLAAIESLLERPEEGERLARAGRERLAERWSQALMERELARLLAAL